MRFAMQLGQRPALFCFVHVLVAYPAGEATTSQMICCCCVEFLCASIRFCSTLRFASFRFVFWSRPIHHCMLRMLLRLLAANVATTPTHQKKKMLTKFIRHTYARGLCAKHEHKQRQQQIHTHKNTLCSFAVHCSLCVGFVVHLANVCQLLNGRSISGRSLAGCCCCRCRCRPLLVGRNTRSHCRPHARSLSLSHTPWLLLSFLHCVALLLASLQCAALWATSVYISMKGHVTFALHCFIFFTIIDNNVLFFSTKQCSSRFKKLSELFIYTRNLQNTTIIHTLTYGNAIFVNCNLCKKYVVVLGLSYHCAQCGCRFCGCCFLATFVALAHVATCICCKHFICCV